MSASRNDPSIPQATNVRPDVEPKSRWRARRLLAIFVLLLLAAVLGAAVHYAIGDPERRALDEQARAVVPGRYVRLSDGITRYEVRGAATLPTVVLVHGFSTPMHIWNGTFEHLADAGLRVVRYDLYGRGYSDRPDVTYDAELYDRQLDELVSQLELRTPVDLVGLSMGTQIVARFAARRPELVGRVALISPSAVRKPPPKSLLESIQLARGIGEYLFMLGSEDRVQGQLRDFVDASTVPANYLRDYRAAMQFHGFRRAILSTLRHPAGDMPGVYSQLGENATPVAVIWGRQDKVTPFANHELLFERLTPAMFVEVDEAGHLPHIEKRDLVARQLSRFLRDDDTDARGPEGSK